MGVSLETKHVWDLLGAGLFPWRGRPLPLDDHSNVAQEFKGQFSKGVRGCGESLLKQAKLDLIDLALTKAVGLHERTNKQHWEAYSRTSAGRLSTKRRRHAS